MSFITAAGPRCMHDRICMLFVVINCHAFVEVRCIPGVIFGVSRSSIGIHNRPEDLPDVEMSKPCLRLPRNARSETQCKRINSYVESSINSAYRRLAAGTNEHKKL